MTSELKDLAAALQKMDAGWPNYAQWEVGLPAGHWRAILDLLSVAPKAPEPQADLVEVLAEALKVMFDTFSADPSKSEAVFKEEIRARQIARSALAAFDAASLVREGVEHG